MTLGHRLREAALARSLKTPDPGTLGDRIATAEVAHPVTAITSPSSGPTVRRMACPLCEASWTFTPPIWLGDPWPRDATDRIFAGHMRLVHDDTIDLRDQETDQ